MRPHQSSQTAFQFAVALTCFFGTLCAISHLSITFLPASILDPGISYYVTGSAVLTILSVFMLIRSHVRAS